MTKKEHQSIYVSPYMETMNIEAQAIICQSGGIDNMQRDDDGGELFN